MSFNRQFTKRQLQKRAPLIYKENQRLKFKLDVANSTGIVAVILLMILAYTAGYLVGVR